MLKFFRKIRRKFINEGKLNRYLIYALGEVVLVILGILVALGINEWRNKVNAKENEKLIVESLLIEFSKTKSQIIEYIGINEKLIDTNEELLKLCLNESEEFEASRFDSLVYLSAWHYSLTLNQGVFKELISTGKLSEISNRDLRVLLSSWDGLLYEVKDDDHVGENYLLTKIEFYFDKNISWVQMSKYDETGVQISMNSPRQINRINIARDLEFENFIYNLIWLTQHQINSAKHLLVLNEEILNELKKDI